jgi:ribosomal-protein-alanine N-acetyltransferase
MAMSRPSPCRRRPAARTPAIRRARPTDLPAILLIEHSNFPPGEAFEWRQVRRLLANPRAMCHVMENDGLAAPEAKLAAWCVGLLRRSGRTLTGRVYTLAADPSCHGKGVGRRMMTHLLAAMKRRGVRRVYLEVRSANSRAIGLYEKLGFRTVRVLRHYYRKGEHGLSMRRDL